MNNRKLGQLSQENQEIDCAINSNNAMDRLESVKDLFKSSNPNRMTKGGAKDLIKFMDLLDKALKAGDKLSERLSTNQHQIQLHYSKIKK